MIFPESSLDKLKFYKSRFPSNELDLDNAYQDRDYWTKMPLCKDIPITALMTSFLFTIAITATRHRFPGHW